MITDKQINKAIMTWLVAPYNISLAILTVVLWSIIYFMSYSSNQNFDMVPTVINNIIYFSTISLSGGLIIKNSDIAAAAVLNVLVAMFTIVIIKTLDLHSIGCMILLPITLFGFLLVIKHICIEILAEKK